MYSRLIYENKKRFSILHIPHHYLQFKTYGNASNEKIDSLRNVLLQSNYEKNHLNGTKTYYRFIITIFTTNTQ